MSRATSPTKKIEILTPAQEKALAEYREEWLAHGRSCAPSDRKACESVWREMYTALGEKPPMIFWWDGPATCAMATSLLKSNLGANLGANLRANLRANLWANLRDNLGANLRDNLGDNLWANLRDNLGANLRANLRANLWDNLGANLPWFWGQHESAWPVYYSWPHLTLRKIHSDNQAVRLGWWLTISKSTGWWHPYEGAVMACERPERQSTDAQGRLHHETGPALLCRDGWPLYSWHGVSVPAQVIERPDRISTSAIDSETNAEVRRVMIERYGASRYLLDSGAQKTHTDDYGTLYRKARQDDTDLVMVKVVNSTPESDGTFKDYFLRVPPEMKTAREAVAWTFDKSESEYAPSEES